MAVLDFARGRVACQPQMAGSANRAIGAHRQRRRPGMAVEIGWTLLVLMLIAIGILALRFVLVVAHGVVQ
ncbi:MAG TPA: hypothetical protein VJX94_18880 [Stellaceae bacterium]|nr:hypothetical protein [Stellaceae bacterium]